MFEAIVNATFMKLVFMSIEMVMTTMMMAVLLDAFVVAVDDRYIATGKEFLLNRLHFNQSKRLSLIKISVELGFSTKNMVKTPRVCAFTDDVFGEISFKTTCRAQLRHSAHTQCIINP